jgi:hypothetical protein
MQVRQCCWCCCYLWPQWQYATFQWHPKFCGIGYAGTPVLLVCAAISGLSDNTRPSSDIQSSVALEMQVHQCCWCCCYLRPQWQYATFQWHPKFCGTGYAGTPVLLELLLSPASVTIHDLPVTSKVLWHWICRYTSVAGVCCYLWPQWQYATFQWHPVAWSWKRVCKYNKGNMHDITCLQSKTWNPSNLGSI